MSVTVEIMKDKLKLVLICCNHYTNVTVYDA
jgi:hypothetical protein